MGDVAWLFECEPLDLETGQVKRAYFSNGLDSEAEFPDRPPYPVRLVQGFFHETGVFDLNVPGGSTVSVGSATINNVDGRFDSLLRYAWDSRPVRVKRGEKGKAYSTYTTEFVGTVIEATADQDGIVLTLRDNSYKLLKPLQTNKYLGTGGAEGGADIREERKPLLFGRARNIAPVWVDNVFLFAQINDGPITSVQAVYDRANALTFYQNFTTYGALASATIPPGSYATSLETGFIRLGAPPAGALTVDAVGMYPTATNLPELLKQILLGKGGLVTGDLNVPSFTQASLDAPEDFEGLYYQQPDMQLDELAELIVTSFNGFWYSNRQGLITVGQFKFGTSVAKLQAQDLMSLGKSASPPPIHRVKVSYGKNPTPMSPSDFIIDRRTFGGYLTKKYHHVDASGTPNWAGAGVFNVFLGDTPVNDLGQVTFQVRDGQSWISIDTVGNIFVTDPGAATASAVLRANFGEYVTEELFTVVKDTAAPLNKIDLTVTRDHFYFDDTNAPNPSVQTSTITATGSNTTAPITITAVDNLGQPVTLTGGNTITAANLPKSPMAVWIDVTATDSSGTPVKQGRRILIHRGSTGILVDESDIANRRRSDLLQDDWSFFRQEFFTKKWQLLTSPSYMTFGNIDANVPGSTFIRVGSAQTDLVTNGQFGTNTNGWTASAALLSTSSNKLRVTSNAAANGTGWQAITCVIGQSYVFTYDAANVSGTNAQAQIANDSAGTTTLYSSTATGNGISTTFTATQTTHYIRLSVLTGTSLRSADFDNVSVIPNVIDELFAVWKDVPVPFDLNHYYQVEFLARKVSGNPQISLGLEATDANGVVIDTGGGTSHTSAHFVAAAGVVPGNSWTYYRGYVKGTSATGTSGSTTLTAPGVMRDGTAFIRPIIRLNYGAPGSVDFTHVRIRRADDLDAFPDGTNYGKVKKAQLATDGSHLLTIGGTNALQVGDQRNLPPVKAVNLGFLYTGAVSATASPTGATINTAAGSFTIGGSTISYGAKSVNVTKVNATDLWFLYLVDAGYTGTGTLVATRTNSSVYDNDNKVYMGQIQITYPSSGTTTPSGDSPSGSCVEANSWVPTQRGNIHARDVVVGDKILVLSQDMESVEFVEVTANHVTAQYGYRLTTEGGVILELSDSTPLTLQDGSAVFPPEYDGEPLPVYSQAGGLKWEAATCDYVGLMEVAHISCDSRIYAASKYGGKFLLTHNVNQYPKP